MNRFRGTTAEYSSGLSKNFFYIVITTVKDFIVRDFNPGLGWSLGVLESSGGVR